MSTDVLAIVHARIADRREKHKESDLLATAHVVNAMSDRQARIVYSLLVDRPLVIVDADLAQLVAQRLGIEPRWMHVDLVPGATWEPGRKELER